MGVPESASWDAVGRRLPAAIGADWSANPIDGSPSDLRHSSPTVPAARCTNDFGRTGPANRR